MTDSPRIEAVEAKYETIDELEAANADLEPLTYDDADFTYDEAAMPPDQLHRLVADDPDGS
jgi:hypothetical protein